FPGTYSVVADGPGTCDASDEVIISATSGQNACVITSVNDISEEPAECFPNPFNEVLQIKAKGAFSYSIFDMQGTRVEEGAGHDGLNAGEDLMPGLYLLRIKNEEVTRIIKICKN